MPSRLGQPGGRLTIEEGEQTLAGLNRGESIRAIARELDRAASTVSRELRANMHHQRYGQRHRRRSGLKATPARREAFYWAMAVATFAMGTALGDFTAYTLHLGYFSSTLVFAFVITIPAIGFR